MDDVCRRTSAVRRGIVQCARTTWFGAKRRERKCDGRRKWGLENHQSRATAQRVVSRGDQTRRRRHENGRNDNLDSFHLLFLGFLHGPLKRVRVQEMNEDSVIRRGRIDRADS